MNLNIASKLITKLTYKSEYLLQREDNLNLCPYIDLLFFSFHLFFKKRILIISSKDSASFKIKRCTYLSLISGILIIINSHSTFTYKLFKRNTFHSNFSCSSVLTA